MSYTEKYVDYSGPLVLTDEDMSVAHWDRNNPTSLPVCEWYETADTCDTCPVMSDTLPHLTQPPTIRFCVGVCTDEDTICDLCGSMLRGERLMDFSKL